MAKSLSTSLKRERVRKKRCQPQVHNMTLTRSQPMDKTQRAEVAFATKKCDNSSHVLTGDTLDGHIDELRPTMNSWPNPGQDVDINSTLY